MSVKRVKLSMVLYISSALFLGLCVGFLGGIGVRRITMVEQTKNNFDGQSPVRLVTISIDPSTQEQLFAQMREFADKWAYAIRIAPAEPTGKYFRVDLWRSDIKILGLYGDGMVDLAFSYTDPTHPVPLLYFDEEIENLNTFINEIPGATLTVK